MNSSSANPSVSDERLYQVLVSPIVSEKSTTAAELHRQFVFRVLPDATRYEVKAAIEKAFAPYYFRHLLRHHGFPV